MDHAPDTAHDLDEEPERQVPGGWLSALPQFFVFPLILVVTLTLAYLSLRALVGGEPADARRMLAEARAAGGEHARWQTLHGLANGLGRGTVTLDEVPATELVALYAAHSGESPAMRQFLLGILKWKRAPELTALALAALDDPDAEVRLSALVALAQMEDPAAVPDLVARLGSPSADERWVALGALARIGDGPSLDAVASRLAGGDGLMHRNAVLALAAAGDERARPWLPALLDRAGYASDPALDDPFAAPAGPESRAAAREDVVEQFLVNASRAAAAAGWDELAPALRSLRVNDPSVKVRSAAINALHDLGAPE